MELLRCIVGSTFWWDAAFTGSVASTFSLRERLRFAGSEDSLVGVGGAANVHGVAAASQLESSRSSSPSRAASSWKWWRAAKNPTSPGA